MTHSETSAPTLRGRWLALARAGWAILIALNLGLFAAAIPALHAQRGAPSEAVRAELAGLGISEGLYAAYFTTLLAAFGLGCFGVAAVIAYRRSDDPMALFVSIFLVLLGTANHPNVQALAATYPAWGPLLKFSWWLLWAALILFIFLFPDGRFTPRWTWVPVVFLIGGTFVVLYFGEGTLTEPPDALGLILVGGLVAGAAAQIYRYRRVSSPEERQQTKWVVTAITAAILAQMLVILVAPLFTEPGATAVLYNLADTTVITVAFFLIPLSIGIAIVRYRLWDIDLIINRALVYSALTACVVGLYVLVVGGIGVLLRVQGNLLVSILAAGLVAVLFQPLRDRLQKTVNRLMYGERDDPYAVISRLGERLEDTLAPEAVLPTIVQTVREALKLPYAAIKLGEGEESTVVSESGSPADGLLRLPLVYQGETVGELLLSPRAPGEEFSPADRRLLEDLARQAGIAAHTVRLTNDLQRSRERLVSTREEERRRLRRDLHDGLGPMLGSLTLKLDVADDLVEGDPAAARALIRGLKTQAQSAVTDIRRLVHALRPPALDDLGLVGAIRETAAQYGANGLRVSVEVPEHLPPLPAAVEVAVYRIAQEALTNVARHAGASRCSVMISPGEAAGELRLEVQDDGRGIPEERGRGVGIASMRERAEELGGSCLVEPSPRGGTRVCARLPLSKETSGFGRQKSGRNSLKADT